MKICFHFQRLFANFYTNKNKTKVERNTVKQLIVTPTESIAYKALELTSMPSKTILIPAILDLMIW